VWPRGVVPRARPRAAGRRPGAARHVATRRADQGVAVSTLRVDLAAIYTAHLLAGISLDLRDPSEIPSFLTR